MPPRLVITPAMAMAAAELNGSKAPATASLGQWPELLLAAPFFSPKVSLISKARSRLAEFGGLKLARLPCRHIPSKSSTLSQGRDLSFTFIELANEFLFKHLSSDCARVTWGCLSCSCGGGWHTGASACNVVCICSSWFSFSDRTAFRVLPAYIAVHVVPKHDRL